MQIAIGTDHAGVAWRDDVIREVRSAGHDAIECGSCTNTPVDYPDVARDVGEAVLGGRAERGILICGSGIGAAIAANKLRGIRAGVCHDCYSATQAVEHDDVNVLCLGARVIGPALATLIVRHFLSARFSGEPRHVRRLEKIRQLESS